MIKICFLYILVLFCVPMLCACEHSKINTQTGTLGHRADKLNEYVVTQTKKIERNPNIIYLGRDYENNNFGPGKIKFVFEK